MILEIITHSGSSLEFEVDSYDAPSLNEQLNNNEINTVCIGNRIFSKIDIKYIGPK
ncbi:hypothetical protein H1D32_13430 [Anaerobacillus sp. CMMVII]|uniref:hypothetical protein n=1 Tax=Anaerobacillus sp. CMMVII TaxID=2755588 RepID=UPI0021B799EE|nr:hypothetical protein [Anaerobacillus sp. CMMVII]MCT8138656.1 hypothetical protein [Anaerobacillus sp. CMMVII]